MSTSFGVPPCPIDDGPMEDLPQHPVANFRMTPTLAVHFLNRLYYRALWDHDRARGLACDRKPRLLESVEELEDIEVWRVVRAVLRHHLRQNTYPCALDGAYRRFIANLAGRLAVLKPEWFTARDDILLHPPSAPVRPAQPEVEVQPEVDASEVPQQRHEEGKARALRLLQSYLDEEQWQSLIRLGYFRVRSNLGNTWLVLWDRIANLIRIAPSAPHGCDLRLCMHAIGVPLGDVILAQICLLMTDEVGAIAKANRHSVYHFDIKDYPELAERCRRLSL